MRTMLVTLLAIIFGLLAHPAQAAEAKPVHQQSAQLVPRVVAFGDSITLGVGTDHPERQSWPALIGAKRVARAGGCLVVEGCWGKAAAIHTYDRQVLGKRPDIVVLAYGINDQLAGSTSPTQDVIRGMRSIIRENRALGIRTYVATITPVRMEIAFDPTRVAHNKAIRAAFGNRVIDFDRALIGPDGKLPRRYDSGDGIHPNALGYEVMARTAAAVIN